jgi:hypothetical protein
VTPLVDIAKFLGTLKSIRVNTLLAKEQEEVAANAIEGLSKLGEYGRQRVYRGKSAVVIRPDLRGASGVMSGGQRELLIWEFCMERTPMDLC